MVFEYISHALGEWKWSVAVLPFILLAFAPTTDAKYDFPVYRMHQYDVTKEQFGSRTSLVSFEGRTVTATQIARKTVLIKIEELTQSLFASIMDKGPGALLILLPEEIISSSFPKNISEDKLNKIYNAEKILLQAQNTPIPVYFSFENAELGSIYREIQSSSEFLGASAILNAGNQLLHQFSVSGAQPVIEKKKLHVLESRLTGTEQDSKIILVTARLDAFAASFGLARGANSGSGSALLLELARLLSMVYEDDSTRPKVTVLFALMPADGFNYLASRDWLDEMERQEGTETLKNIDLAICLDGIGLPGPLYIHYSKPPKESTKAHYFINSLIDNKHSVQVKQIHKKINLADEKIWWQHERFGFKKVPSLTLSSIKEPTSVLRSSMLDTYGIIDEKAFQSNAYAISDAIISIVYQSIVDDDGLTVTYEAIKAWNHDLATEPRPAGNMTTRLYNNIITHLEKFSSDGKVEKRTVCGDITFYSRNTAVMSQFLVRPALFDLYLGALIFSYLGALYMMVENFSVILSYVTPILARPALVKKLKAN